MEIIAELEKKLLLQLEKTTKLQNEAAKLKQYAAEMKKEAADLKDAATEAKSLKFQLSQELDKAQVLQDDLAREKKEAITFNEQLSSTANAKFIAVEEHITALQQEIAAVKKSNEEGPSQTTLLISEHLLPLQTELNSIKPQVQNLADAAAEAAKKEFAPLELVQQLKESVDAVVNTVPANADKLDELSADMKLMGETIAQITETLSSRDDAKKGEKGKEKAEPSRLKKALTSAEREKAAEKKKKDAAVAAKKKATEEETEEEPALEDQLIRRKRASQPPPPQESTLKKARTTTAPSGSSQPKTTTPSSTSNPTAAPKLKWSLVPKKVQPAVFKGLLKPHLPEGFWYKDGDNDVPRDFMYKWEELKEIFIKWFYGLSRLPQDDATTAEVWKIFLYLYQKQDVVEMAKELEKQGKLNLSRVPPKRKILPPKILGHLDRSLPPHEANTAADILGIDKTKDPEEFAKLTADIHGLYGFPVSD